MKIRVLHLMPREDIVAGMDGTLCASACGCFTVQKALRTERYFRKCKVFLEKWKLANEMKHLSYQHREQNSKKEGWQGETGKKTKKQLKHSPFLMLPTTVIFV